MHRNCRQNNSDFELHQYSPNDLAYAISNLMSDPELLAKMGHQIEKDKWNWDAKAVYPEFLNYLN